MALDKDRGARIKELRTAHGYRQQYVADQVGVTLRGYQFWEEGKSPPGGDNLKRLAKVLETDSRYIMRGDVPDLLGAMGGDTLARLERIETTIERNSAAIDRLREDHALIIGCVDQLQTVIEQLAAAGVLDAVARASEQEVAQRQKRAREAGRFPAA